MLNRSEFAGIAWLLSDIKKYPPLTSAEERELFSSLGRTRNPAQQNELREKAILHNVLLIVSVAQKHQGRGLSLEDLVGEGMCGLIRAVKDFDIARGNKFSTYATWWIRQAIVRAIRRQCSTIYVPEYLVKELQKIQRKIGQTNTEKGYGVTRESIESSPKDSHSEFRKLAVRALSTVSTDAEHPFGEKGGSYTIQPRSGEISPLVRLRAREELTAARHSVAVTLGYLEALPISDRDKTIFKRHENLLGDDSIPRTLQSIADTFGVTRQRVQQICFCVWQCLQKAGSPFDAESLASELRRIADIQQLLDEGPYPSISPVVLSSDQKQALLDRLGPINIGTKPRGRARKAAP